MSSSTVCVTVQNASDKPDESGDASAMAGSNVQSHSRGLCNTETEGDAVDEVVMCVVWGGWKIGLSFYSVDTGFLHTMSDIAEAEDFGLTKRGGILNIKYSPCSRWFESLTNTVLAQVEPKVVVVSSKVDERLLRILRAYGILRAQPNAHSKFIDLLYFPATPEEEEDSRCGIKIDILPSSDFSK